MYWRTNMYLIHAGLTLCMFGLLLLGDYLNNIYICLSCFIPFILGFVVSDYIMWKHRIIYYKADLDKGFWN